MEVSGKVTLTHIKISMHLFLFLMNAFEMLLPINNKKSLVSLINSLLEPYGFKRVKDDWYLDNIECISVIGLGKSLYGGQFSIGVALLLKQLSPTLLPYPSFHLCNFRQNIKFIVAAPDELTAALNLENDLLSIDRLRVITEAVVKYAVPFILRLSTKESILLKMQHDEDFSSYCRLELKEFIKPLD